MAYEEEIATHEDRPTPTQRRATHYIVSRRRLLANGFIVKSFQNDEGPAPFSSRSQMPIAHIPLTPMSLDRRQMRAIILSAILFSNHLAIAYLDGTQQRSGSYFSELIELGDNASGPTPHRIAIDGRGRSRPHCQDLSLHGFARFTVRTTTTVPPGRNPLEPVMPRLVCNPYRWLPLA